MNRWSTLLLIGLAGLLASCGSSVTSSTQAGPHDEYSVVVSPSQFTLNAGDWSSISAVSNVSHLNGTPKLTTPQPTIKFFTSDPRVTVSATGEVCAGQWDSRYLTCTPTVVPALTCNTTCVPNANAGQLDLPTGYVTITAYDSSHSTSGTAIVSIHPRATGIALSAPGWTTASAPTGLCISQNQQVKYIATPTYGANAPSTQSPPFDNDYAWTVGDTDVATVSTHGYVIAHNPGVTNVYATLNGTVSTPLAFATCPPASIVLEHSAFNRGAPVPPFSTADLSSTDSNCASTDSCALNKGDQKYLTITQVLDANGNQMFQYQLDASGNPLVCPGSTNCAPITLPITYISSDLLIGTFTVKLPLTDDFVTQTSGHTHLMAACAPPTCNASVPDFSVPSASGPVPVNGKSAGFGYPVYSNVIAVTVQGITPTTVLVTGTTFADGVTPIYRLLAYDSESLAVIHAVELANSPNSLVVAPNGAKAYVGSSAGLVVVDLTTYGSSLQTFPIVGGQSTDVITGKVVGVSPDSRYVLISDTSNPDQSKQYVFFIDTTGTKAAMRFTIPGIRAATFAPDGSNMWIAGDSGVYVFNSDTYVRTLTNVSTHVNSLAWTPDGQSYFASGDLLTNYSTCDDQNPQSPSIPVGSPINLSTTAIGGVPHVIGLSPAPNNEWLDYSVTKAPPVGYVCAGTVVVNASAPIPSTIACTPKQITFSARLGEAFVTGVDPACSAPDAFIHGYSMGTPGVSTPAEIKLPTNPNLNPNLPIIPLSGGVLTDGRELYIGTWNSVAKTAALHRFNLLTASGAQGTLTEDIAPVSVELVPSFVAVVPK